MIVISWNVQWCRGCDGRVDPQRIVEHALSLADFDVLCLQEVAAGFDDLEGSRGEDQFALIAALLPGYHALDAVAVDRCDAHGRRQRFGNMLLSRLPVIGVERHLLPWPACSDYTGMPRVLVHAVLQTPTGPMRVATTHLEYYSSTQRNAQVERLRELHAQACGHADDSSRAEPGKGPFRPHPLPRSLILCGDFNLPPQDPAHAAMLSPMPAGAPPLHDAWTVTHPGREHTPTFRVHDTSGRYTPYACDFLFVTEDLVPRVQRVDVDSATRASDHQPVLLELAPG